MHPDADPGCQGPYVVAAMDKFTWTTEIPWRKREAQPFSQEESALTLALTGFYCFSGHITWMVLIYYAQVPLGDYLLQITKEKKLLITSKKKDICKCKGKSG